MSQKAGSKNLYKRRISILVAMLTVTLSLTTAMADYPEDTFPITSIATPVVRMPEYLKPMIDPTFGSTITRISDQTALDSQETAIKHAYSKNQYWNCDGSLVLLYGSPGYVLDGRTYKELRRINIPRHAVWSNKDPNKTFGTTVTARNGMEYGLNSFVTCNMTTDEWTLLHQFTQYDYICIGEGEGNISNDDRYVALQCKSGANTYLVVYDIQNDSIISTWDMQGRWPNNVSMSQSGNYVAAQWGVDGTGRYQGIEVFGRDLVFQRQLHYNGQAHFDIGYDTSGNEVIAYFSANPNPPYNTRPCMYRLSDGTATDLFGNIQGRMSNWHVSCRNVDRPGWAYYSFYEVTFGTDLGKDEIFAVKLDGSGTVERFGHTQSSGYGISGYDGCPMAVPNRDGTKVLFSSDWKAGAGYNHVIRMSAPTAGTYGVYQRYYFNRIVNNEILIYGLSKAENVSGVKNSDYSIYCDVHYADGTNLFAQTANFSTGTHDWEGASYKFTPEAKAIEFVTVYALFRNKSGTVWFDNITLKESGISANLLENYGFETGTAVPLPDWTIYGSGYTWEETATPKVYAYVAEKKGNNQILRMSTDTTSKTYGASQVIDFDRVVGSITISGKSRAENVSGPVNGDYSISCDVHYTDGTALPGQSASFNTGTHDWDTESYTFTSAKPVDYIALNVNFKNKSGVVWFDDISLTENGGANLLQNSGFQTGASVPIAGWAANGSGYGLDQTSQVIKMSSSLSTEQHRATQGVVFNRATGPITISGRSKAVAVSGTKNTEYSLYCDVKYTDGTYMYGRTASFNTGTHDWEAASCTFTPEKPVESIKVICLFRNKTGTVWFEDIRMTEGKHETNFIQNPGFNTGSSVPLPNWETEGFLPYALTNK